MISLTPNGQRMLAFVVTMHRQNSRWTYRSAARHLGAASAMSAHGLTSQLVERGYVRRCSGKVIPLPPALDAVPPIPFHFVPAPHRYVLP